MRPELNDCFLHDRDRLKHDEALDILKEKLSTVVQSEEIETSDALGRVIDEKIAAPRNVPLSDNSAVDGYVFAHDSYAETGGFFPIVTRIAAGNIEEITLPGGAAARIFTGATMPSGADTVAMQEDCETHEQDGSQFVIIPDGLKKGANCRLAGEDVAEGAVLFESGHQIGPQDIAALASLGRKTVRVFRKIRVAILSTGDELVMPGNNILPGQVYNSNGPLLEGLLQTLPVEITNHGIVPDDYDVIADTLTALGRDHDVILTTGGASRGEEDHILSALDDVGTRHMWQLAIKPGRPMTFGTMGQAAFIGLPGNPVAAFVCFLLYARHVILTLGGAKWQDPVRYPLPAAFEIPKKKTDRREFVRGILVQENGTLKAKKYTRDGSGLITSLREAHGLIEIPEDVSSIDEGQIVSFIPFSDFGI